MLPLLPRQCYHGYQVYVTMVTKSMLPWLPSQCYHGYQVNVTMVIMDIKSMFLRLYHVDIFIFYSKNIIKLIFMINV